MRMREAGRGKGKGKGVMGAYWVDGGRAGEGEGLVVCGVRGRKCFDAEERMRKAESGGVQSGGLDS